MRIDMTYKRLYSKTILTIMTALFMLSSCGDIKVENEITPDAEDRFKDSIGKIGDDIYLIGGDKDNSKPGENGITVNAFLWRAALDTVSFMPLISADPFGGVIITDWYEMPELQNERHKLTISVLSSDLRASGIKVSLFAQKRKNKKWVNIEAQKATIQKIENAILMKARELRIAYTRRQ